MKSSVIVDEIEHAALAVLEMFQKETFEKLSRSLSQEKDERILHNSEDAVLFLVKLTI